MRAAAPPRMHPVCAQCKHAAALERKPSRKLCPEPRRRQSLGARGGGAAVDSACLGQLVVGFQGVRGLPDSADDGDASKRQATQLSEPGGCNTCLTGPLLGQVSFCARQST